MQKSVSLYDSPTNIVNNPVVIVCRECSDRLSGAWGLGEVVNAGR